MKDKIVGTVQKRVESMEIGELLQLSPSFNSLYINRLTKNAYKVGSRMYGNGIANAGASYHTLSGTLEVVAYSYEMLHPEEG